MDTVENLNGRKLRVVVKEVSLKSTLVFTPPRNSGEVMFSLQFVCVCVCLSVCVCLMFACEQNSSQTDEPIWTWFSLNGCLLPSLEPYLNW